MPRFCRLSITAGLLVALFCPIALANDNDVSDGAPDVITTLTPEEAQRIDQQRPKYVQPTEVDQHEDTVLPLTPREGESLVFIGNGLAARMEHFNHFETALHTQFADKRLTFRNMGFPGHTPGYRPEAGNDDPWAFPGAQSFRPEIKAHLGIGHYPKPDEWLTIVKASTVVAFFGFNESFDGLEGVDNFKNELRAFVDHTLTRSYERTKSAPRLVLATPIAMEQHGGYHLPNAEERNMILAAYAEAIRSVAAEKKVGCLELFSTTKQFYADAKEPLTINGVHLSRDGYRKLAPVIMQQLFGVDASPAPQDSLLHQAVEDKAWFWRNDYRMLNGVHAYGRRWAPYGNFNYPEEIAKIRQMTVLRDRNIWAVAPRQIDHARSRRFGHAIAHVRRDELSSE